MQEVLLHGKVVYMNTISLGIKQNCCKIKYLIHSLLAIGKEKKNYMENATEPSAERVISMLFESHVLYLYGSPVSLVTKKPFKANDRI